MRRSRHIVLIIILILLLASSYVFATDLPSPTQDFYVYDEVGLLSSQAKEEIIASNEDLFDQVGGQVVLVILEKLPEDYTSKEAAVDLFNTWGIGTEDEDNGILLLVTIEEREYQMEVGYGLEGAIPDMVANDILNGMKEYFINGDMEAGILYAFSKIIERIEIEYNIEVEVKPRVDNSYRESQSKANLTGFIIRIIVLIAIFYFLQGNNNDDNHRGSGGKKRNYRGPVFFPGSFRGGFGGGSSGGFGGGNIGGGGRSGGGGAGGSW